MRNRDVKRKHRRGEGRRYNIRKQLYIDHIVTHRRDIETDTDIA